MLVVAGIGADQLHLRARQRHVEHARVRGVGEVEAHDLTALGLERQVRLAGDKHHVAEAAHRDVCRLQFPEGGDLSVLDQDVVEGKEQLAVGGRPIVGLAWADEDVSVEAHLLAVVLADMRVVPVGAGVGHVHLVGEGLVDRDRRLRVVRSVVTVLEAKAVPVHGRVEVSVVGHVDGDHRALRDLQSRAGDGAVVGEHAHGGIANPLLDGHDLELEFVAIGELDQLRPACLGQPLRLARELDRLCVAFRARIVHG